MRKVLRGQTSVAWKKRVLEGKKKFAGWRRYRRRRQYKRGLLPTKTDKTYRGTLRKISVTATNGNNSQRERIFTTVSSKFLTSGIRAWIAMPLAMAMISATTTGMVGSPASQKRIRKHLVCKLGLI
jgi:hypothetical protein